MQEAYQRIGVVLVKQDQPQQKWQRSLEELIVGHDVLMNAAGKSISTLDTLRTMHTAHFESYRNEFGLRSPITLTSDFPANTKPLVFPDHPLRFDLIYLQSDTAIGP
ncbi:hypothetical protein [Desulfosarcina ovata]|uniref:Uncharacterized protein n=1 Tax=Desulfosarcina ovata subsp. ovata TaxID=2752305 RepID=A0A5K8A879_9BACT|nr:hypothetical protein [Desulfosarcina ovata]BBO88745.1 hypothetical protein DSCOOX_19250 [Desulfosarcina ovata subsp. ovata]